MRERRVDDDGPDRDERDERAEAHPISGRSADQGGGEDGEHQLKGHEGQRRNGQVHPRHSDLSVGQTGHIKPADQAAEGVVVESERVTHQYPGHRDNSDRHKALHDHAERMLRPDQTRVEEREARGHQQHQRGAHDDPGGVSGVDPCGFGQEEVHRGHFSRAVARISSSAALPRSDYWLLAPRCLDSPQGVTTTATVHLGQSSRVMAEYT